jgi:YggT family protein
MAILAWVAYYLLLALFILMMVRIILWLIGMFIPGLMDNPFSRVITSLTEPIIAPYRAILPQVNGIDFFSFIFSIIVIQLMMNYLNQLARLA